MAKFSRNLAFVYEEEKYNVLVCDESFNLLTIDEWEKITPLRVPIGLAIRSEQYGTLIMDLVEFEGIQYAESSEDFTKDYNIASVGDIDDGCNDWIQLLSIFYNNLGMFPDFTSIRSNRGTQTGQSYYIPTAAEMNVFFDNRAEVEDVLRRVASRYSLDDDNLIGDYQTCTPRDSSQNMYVMWTIGSMSGVTFGSKTEARKLRLFIEII